MIPINYNYDVDFRKKQIDTLKIFNDNVCEIKENEEYTIRFLSAERTITITVALGQNFPNEKPTILISPPLSHQWCDESGTEVKNAPGLLNYTPHSDLGRIVQAIIRELEKHPPSLLNDNQQNNISGSDIQTAPQVQIFPHPTHLHLPELSKLSIDELKRLNSDPVFFEDFVQETSMLQNLNEDLETILVEVETISKENLERGMYLNELRTKMKNSFCLLRQLGENYKDLSQQYEKKTEEFAPEHIKELLQIAASNSDSECERHIEEFLKLKIDVQTFLIRYTKSKKLSAIRKAKEERLDQQIK